MKGKIIKWFKDKGFGFIEDLEGQNRFFHISDVISKEKITQFANVTFTPSKNKRGLTAKDIHVDINRRPTFIILGDTRIKTSNIKNYGIKTETKFFEIIKKEKPKEKKPKEDIKDFMLTFAGLFTKIIAMEVADELFPGKFSYSEPKKETKKHRTEVFNVLYITTYQGDNFLFSEYEEEFDIHEKLKELDTYMTWLVCIITTKMKFKKITE